VSCYQKSCLPSLPAYRTWVFCSSIPHSGTSLISLPWKLVCPQLKLVQTECTAQFTLCGGCSHTDADSVSISCKPILQALFVIACLVQVEAWNRVLVAGAAAGSSGLTKEGFLTRWRVITLEDPRTAFEQVGYVRQHSTNQQICLP
jgi:hypothetical protein